MRSSNRTFSIYNLDGLDTIMILITKKMCCSFFPIFRALFTLDNCNTGKENVNVDRIFRLFLVYLISNAVTWLRSIVNKNWFQNKPFFFNFPQSNKYIQRAIEAVRFVDQFLFTMQQYMVCEKVSVLYTTKT